MEGEKGAPSPQLLEGCRYWGIYTQVPPRQLGSTLIYGPRMFACSHGGPSPLRGLLAPGSLVGTLAQPPTCSGPGPSGPYVLQLLACLKDRQSGVTVLNPLGFLAQLLSPAAWGSLWT